MKVLASTGRDDVAMVYVVDMGDGRLIECVESVQPPIPREDKWVLLVSTMFGCPIGCSMCDAGGHYQGKPSKEQILAQIDFLVNKRYPDKVIPAKQFKIQFARMGEPTLNPNVLDVLDELPGRYTAPGLMPSLSTVAPKGSEEFFERLLQIKNANFSGGHFQFQFSIHTTDNSLRDQMIPVKKWSFAEMEAYGERFYAPSDRKITLNFALANNMPVETSVLLRYFNPDKFLIKITPLNPTYRAVENNLSSYIDPQVEHNGYEIVEALKQAGYQVIVSIGEVEENLIGSNCGQYIKRHLAATQPISDGYTYTIQDHS
ncbi:MAG: radical SAM protein [Chloroflexota bacterium]|nr:MAG: radical SAM protein [Chloroflexota bacterium]